MNDFWRGSITFHNQKHWADEFFKIFYPNPVEEQETFKYTEEDDDIYWTTGNDSKILEIMMPGYSKDDVKVTAVGKDIEIKWGYKSTEDSSELEDTNSYSFTLPECYDIPTDVTVKHGILTMEFKKKENKETINIPVN